MRKLFRFISLAMVSALTLSMFSCGEDAPEPIPEKTGVFRAEEIIPPDDYIFNDYADIGWSNGYFTIEGRTKLDPEHPEKDQERVLLKVAEDGTQTVEFNKLALNGTIKMYTRKLNDGKTISIEGTFDTDHYADVKLIVRDKKDKVTSEHALNDIFGIKIEDMTFDPMSASVTFYPRFADERDGVIYVVTTIGAAKIDGDNISTIMSRQQIRSSAYGSDGIVVVTDDRNGNIKRADFDAGEFVSVEIPNSQLLMRPFALDGYVIAGVIDGQIVGWTRDENGELTQELLCDPLTADVAGQMTGLAAVSDREFYIGMINELDGGTNYYRLTMLAPDEIKEKETLTVALSGLRGNSAAYAVSEFNRTHDDIRIELRQYDMTEPNTFVENFERDMVSGNIADVVILGSSFDVANYAEKGFFIDLYPIMDAAGYDKGNFMDSISGFERNGTLPYIPLGSRIDTLFGRKSDFPDKLTLDAFLDKLENLEDDVTLVDYLRFSNILETAMDEFVDFETGKTNFSNDLFRRFAEDYKKYGDLYRHIESHKSGRRDDIYPDFASGKQLLLDSQLNIANMAELEAKYGVDDLEIVGNPHKSGNGSTLSPSTYIGITKNCKNTAAAWEFIALRISDKYKENYLTKSAFENYMNSLPRYYAFATGSTAWTPLSDEPNDESLKAMLGDYRLFEVTDEFRNTLRDTVAGASILPPMWTKLRSIVMEELNTYISREGMSLDEAIKIIDNRVNTYYNEKN